MDLAEEILQRLTITEDHLTERKSSAHRDQCTEAMVAFANSALPEKPGILYVGVNNAGEILQDKTSEKWQHEITSWANGCSPELGVIPRTLTKSGKEFLAVVVPLSPARPHFARPAFRRQGAKTIPASQKEIDEWIAYRSSKVRFILENKGRPITLLPLKMGAVGSGDQNAGEYTVVDCNEHWVTLSKVSNSRIVTHPLSYIDLKMNEGKPYPPGQLCLLLKQYF